LEGEGYTAIQFIEPVTASGDIGLEKCSHVLFYLPGTFLPRHLFIPPKTFIRGILGDLFFCVFRVFRGLQNLAVDLGRRQQLKFKTVSDTI
jgi:hypothetical protein